MEPLRRREPYTYTEATDPKVKLLQYGGACIVDVELIVMLVSQRQPDQARTESNEGKSVTILIQFAYNNIHSLHGTRDVTQWLATCICIFLQF